MRYQLSDAQRQSIKAALQVIGYRDDKIANLLDEVATQAWVSKLEEHIKEGMEPILKYNLYPKDLDRRLCTYSYASRTQNLALKTLKAIKDELGTPTYKLFADIADEAKALGLSDCENTGQASYWQLVGWYEHLQADAAYDLKKFKEFHLSEGAYDRAVLLSRRCKLIERILDLLTH